MQLYEFMYMGLNHNNNINCITNIRAIDGTIIDGINICIIMLLAMLP